MGVPPTGEDREAFWRDYLTRGDSFERRARGVLRLLLHDPRCQLCAAPFAGPAAGSCAPSASSRRRRIRASARSCFTFIEQHHGGAEIEASFLFADVRGSTTLAERMSATEFRALLDRFYATATACVIANGGGVDKFVGDEVVALFVPLMSGPRHPAHAVAAAQAVLRATGHGDPGGPWIPVGAGVHTGMAWVGAVGDESHTELTALGDTVNVTARLASAADAGEILVTSAAAQAAGLDPRLERQHLALKGKVQSTEVVSLRVTAAPPKV